MPGNRPRNLRFAVIGMSGFAQAHLAAVQWLDSQGIGELAAVIALPEDQAANPGTVAELKTRRIRIYPSIDSFFEQYNGEIDVLTVPIGIHEHVPVSIRALRKGMHVYCEKPVAATIQEARELIAVQRETGGKVAIGYQHLYSRSITEIKAHLCSGKLGQLEEIRLMCGWPRSREYYSRNAWAGKIRVGDSWILDSPPNNAVSHYLMNTLYLASGEPSTAARPARLRAQLYRANRIECADLAQISYETEEGTRVFVHLAHCNEEECAPRMHLRCAHGEASWEHDSGRTEIRVQNGSVVRTDNDTHASWRFEGFRDLVLAIAEDRAPLCTPEVAACQTLAINAMHDSCPVISTIPDAFIDEGEALEMWPPDQIGHFRRVRGLDGLLAAAFEEGKWFGELGAEWASPEPGGIVSTENYKTFPSGEPPR